MVATVSSLLVSNVPVRPAPQRPCRGRIEPQGGATRWRCSNRPWAETALHKYFSQACHPLPGLGVGARVRRWTSAVAIDRNDYSGPNDRDSRCHLSMFASEIPAREDLYVASVVDIDEAAATAGFDGAYVGGKSLSVAVRPHEIGDQVLAQGLFDLHE